MITNFVYFTNMAGETIGFSVLTNDSPANLPQVPDVLEPIARALPDWGAQVIVWVATVAIVLAPFRGMISRWLANVMNRAAESSQLEDDEFLRRLFSKPWYQTAAVFLRFVSVDLPTLAQLERAIAFQKEAVAEATKDSNV